MTDWLTREQRSRNMASIRSQGNATTEQALLKLFRAARITGWRRHPDLPGKPDFIFPVQCLIVFVDGCFWHGCPRCYRLPQDNRRYWKSKVELNRRRDRRRTNELRARDWRVLRIWEHALNSSAGRARTVKRIRVALNQGCAKRKVF